MKRNTWIALVGAGVVATALLAWAFAPRAVEVEAVAAARGPFETAVEEDGRTRVRERHAVTAPMAGRLHRIALREGDAVQAGQALALIEPLPVPLLDERSRREQQARAAAAQAALELGGARVRAAQVGVEQALNEQRRTAQLVAQGFVSPAKADADRLALDAATREREAAVEGERVARFELQQARVALDLTAGAASSGRAFTVRAPVTGTVLRVHQASEGVVGVGTPLLDLADTRRIEIVAELLTSDAALAQPGSPVRIERWGGPGSLAGQVRRVEPAAFTKVSALGVEEQRVNVLIDLVPASTTLAPSAPSATSATSAAPAASAASRGGASRADAAPAALLGDGWRVVVRILTRQEADMLRVPVSAVFPWPGPGPAQAPDTMGVFVVEGGRARLRAVQVVARNGSLAWVRSGLTPGEVVIAYPPPAVAEGVRVKPRQG
jgi:HlyD family secretion protein